jgi:hypothetical protein
MKRQKSVPPGLPQPDLCDHYGKIGISAVAAAMLYRGDVKIPQHSPQQPRVEEIEDDDSTWSSAA